MKVLRPIKAPGEQVDFADSRIVYPMLALPKIDGFRALLLNGVFYSPALKPFANQYLYCAFESLVTSARHLNVVIDCELSGVGLSFSELSALLRSRYRPWPQERVVANAFDHLTEAEWNGQALTPYQTRLSALRHFLQPLSGPVRCVHSRVVANAEEARATYKEFLGRGYEGLILRAPLGWYKHGRCTAAEANMLKFKEFRTVDGNIIEVIQRRRLCSHASRLRTPDGRLARTHKQDDYTLVDAVGSFRVRLEDGRVCSAALGKGFADVDRRMLWQERQNLIGLGVELKHMPYGAKNSPRLGSIIRFRPDKNKPDKNK